MGVGGARRGAARPRHGRRQPAAAARAGRRAARAGGRRGRRLQRDRGGAAPRGRPGRRRDLPLPAELPRRRAAHVRLLRPARPQGADHAVGAGAGRLAGGGQHPAGPRRRHLDVRADRADLDLPVHPRRRALPRGAGLARGDRARAVVPPVDARAPRRRGPVRGDPAELRPATAAVRPALSVRGLVRPGLRPGLQRRRDGERGDGHLQRRLPVPVEGDAGPAPAAGHGGGARDGAHVVRRPGHDALVGRPLAERVLRRAARHAHRGRGDRPAGQLGGVHGEPQGVGLRGRPAADHPPGGHRRRRQPERAARTSTGSATRRARRCCAS